MLETLDYSVFDSTKYIYHVRFDTLGLYIDSKFLFFPKNITPFEILYEYDSLACRIAINIQMYSKKVTDEYVHR